MNFSSVSCFNRWEVVGSPYDTMPIAAGVSTQLHNEDPNDLMIYFRAWKFVYARSIKHGLARSMLSYLGSGPLPSVGSSVPCCLDQ